MNLIVFVFTVRKSADMSAMAAAGGELHNFEQMLKSKHLSQLMDIEQKLYKQIQSLDNEMQTLVYENYNKFISATETIRKVNRGVLS